jgi:hypothetical protein|tara:strand:+ start:412 stop:936 length:525 start_codon:yes stop_codon:yes gene_type:complete
MGWAAIATSDVQTRMTDTELAKYNSIGLAAGQTSSGLIQEVSDDVAALVRGYIKGCPRNNLASTAAALPDVLHSPALDIIIVELMKRVGGAITDVSDVRIAAYNSAIAFMDKVSDCRFAIPKPVTETTDTFYDDRGGYGYKKKVCINNIEVINKGITSTTDDCACATSTGAEMF